MLTMFVQTKYFVSIREQDKSGKQESLKPKQISCCT